MIGQTDEFGFKAVENPVSIHDLHATLLYVLGIDHEKLTKGERLSISAAHLKSTAAW